MAEKAKYCYCLNDYTISKCDRHNCDDDRRDLWAQGIGKIKKED
jgi:hypothetical protein